MVQNSGMVTIPQGLRAVILQVLRQPLGPNAFYHTGCYVPGKREIVAKVLRLRDDQQCSACGAIIASGPCSDEQEDQGKLVQLSLF
jgi:hypothetical protein